MFKTLLNMFALAAFLLSNAMLYSQEILHFESIVDYEQIVDEGIYDTLFVAFPPGDSNLAYMVLKSGAVRVLDTTTTRITPEPFLVVDDVSKSFQGGLYCLAFHPDYEVNGRLFVCYTAQDGDFVIQEYLRENENQAVSGRPIFVIDHFFNEPFDNGGWIGFGADGNLYASIGGGFGFSAEPNFGGTIIRIDVDGDDFPDREDLNYAIPKSNPLVDLPGYEEIIAGGLKNAWRCSFDGNGNLFIGSLGSTFREEVELIPANHPNALNFGFPCFEGSLSNQDPLTCQFADLPFTSSIYEYEHTDNLSGIIGGYVIEGEVPELNGMYLYADLRDPYYLYSFRFDGTDDPAQFNGDNVFETRAWRTSVPVVSRDFQFVISFSRDSDQNLILIATSGDIFRLDSIRRVGDFNGDDAIDLLDVSPFVEATLQMEYQGLADINLDFSVDLDDVLPFVELIRN